MSSSDRSNRLSSSKSGKGGTAALDDPAPLLDWAILRSCTAVRRDSSRAASNMACSTSSSSITLLLTMGCLDLFFLSAGRKGESDLELSESISDIVAESPSESCSNSDSDSDSSSYSRELLVKYSSWSSSVMAVLETPMLLEFRGMALRVRASDFCRSAIVNKKAADRVAKASTGFKSSNLTERYSNIPDVPTYWPRLQEWEEWAGPGQIDQHIV